MNKQFQTALIDTLWVLLVSIFGMLVIAITMMHKPAPDNPNTDPVNSGTITVIATWDNKRDDDVDLWVQSPDGQAVGFPQKHGAVFDLLRDDIGTSVELHGINMENMYSRGAPPGEYAVSLHWYRCNSGCELPETVHVIVDLKPDPTVSSTTHIFEGDITLPRQGVEKMVIRFTLDSNMKLMGTTHLPKCIAMPTSGGAVLCGGE